MPQFLLELGFEELPARFVPRAMEQLAEAVQRELRAARLGFGEIVKLSTPRRLAVVIAGLQAKQEDLTEEIKGPPLKIARDQAGNLTKAGQGFLRSQGAEAAELFVRQFQGADYLFVRKERPGQETAALLGPLLEKVILGLSFPKNMRWGNGELRYARPLRWIVALLDQELIPLRVGQLSAGRSTFGHRQLGPGPLELASPADYETSLQHSYVLVDPGQRRQAVWEQIKKLSEEQGAVVLDDQALLAEVVNLVEYPTAFCGSFSPQYLEVPAEVLVTSMKEHQRYFPLYAKNGRLLAKFIGVRNGADNHLQIVVRGNENVLEARLADAKFFYDEDRQIELEQNLKKLDRVVFQDGLGFMGAKVSRIERLSGLLASELGYAEHRERIMRTARLAKADLVSQMVNEFPELQGVMGEKYALDQGEDPPVALGIREHYHPRFAGDSLPDGVEGALVSLADKLDTLTGYFALGLIPSGSQDPYALRRQAQGVVQILDQRGFALSLTKLVETAARGYTQVTMDPARVRDLVEFFLARLRVALLDRGFAHDVVGAALASKDDRIPELVGRTKALSEFLDSPAATDLLTGFERVYNLAAKAGDAELDPQVFEAADQEFYNALTELDAACRPLAERGDYQALLQGLAAFRGPVDRFFSEVMIMDQDPRVRGNRLTLLRRALRLYDLCGDLHLIVGNK